MPSNLKRLQDRAAAIAARMTELADIDERSEEQTAELRKLSEEADTVKADLEFEGRLADKEKELRAVVEQATPAPAAPAPVEERKVEIRPVQPHYTSLRAFNEGPESVESAYRCGRWLRATVFKNADDIRWCRDHGVESRAMGEGSNATGGALVPEEFASRVIRLVEEFGTFPPAAENVTMTRDTLVIPKRVTGTTAHDGLLRGRRLGDHRERADLRERQPGRQEAGRLLPDEHRDRRRRSRLDCRFGRD